MSEKKGRESLIVLTGVLLATIGWTFADKKLKIAPGQQYLVLSTSKISTIEKELDEASSYGFRVITGSPTATTEMALFLECVSTPSKPYEYKIVATSRIKSMEKELNEAAQENYRVLPQTFIAKQGMFTNEIVVVLERPPEIVHRYEYMLLGAHSDETLQREIIEAIADGFELAAMVTFSEQTVIMERATKIGQE